MTTIALSASIAVETNIDFDSEMTPERFSKCVEEIIRAALNREDRIANAVVDVHMRSKTNWRVVGM